MRSYTAVVVAAVLAGMLVPWPAQATDLILRQKVTNGGPHPDSREEMQYWTADRMVTDSPDSRVIIDLNARTMTVANKREHTYFTQTAAEMRQNADAMQAEMKKHMENLPPQAREMMEKMHGGATQADAPVSVKPTGKTEKIAGYEAAEYAISGGPMNYSVWASDALQPPAGPKFGERFKEVMGGNGPAAKMAEAMTQLKGIPLRTVMHGGMGPQGFTHTTEVVEVMQQSPPADVMKVPDGYKQVEAPSRERGKRPMGMAPQ